MAESTIIKTKIDGTLLFAALGGGAINMSTGAVSGSAKTYTVAYEAGDVSITLPSRAVNSFLDRGRTPTVPSLRYGDDATGTISFTANLRDLADDAVAVLGDLLATMSGNPSGYVGSAWDSQMDSAAGANDAEVFAVGIKLTITNAGDGTDTHGLAFNYVVGTGTLAEGDPTTLSFSGTIYDAPTTYWIG